jgi:hypothetical protein
MCGRACLKTQGDHRQPIMKCSLQPLVYEGRGNVVVPRGAQAGERRGSRTKGIPNKRTIAVTEKLEALDRDPIEGMARVAMDESQPIRLRAQMYKELAQYVAPKRKAVEVTGEDGGSVKTEMTISAWLDSVNGTRPWGRRTSAQSHISNLHSGARELTC